MSDIVHIFRPSDVEAYTRHPDSVENFVCQAIKGNPKLFEAQFRFFAYFAPPLGMADYQRAGLMYRRFLGDDDPLKDCPSYQLFRRMNEMARKLGAPLPRNPGTMPTIEVVGPTREQYDKILDFALSEMFAGLAEKPPKEIKRFAAMMLGDKALEELVARIAEKGFNVRIEVLV